MMQKFKVHFYPDNKSIEVKKDTTILSAAISCGVYIHSACGGDGVCGRCKVIIKKGQAATQASGLLSLEEKRRNMHLACLSVIHSDLEIEVPRQSRQELEIKPSGPYSQSEEIETQAAARFEKIFKHSPQAVKLYLELPKPSLDDRLSDLERLYRQIRRVQNIPNMQIGLANIKRLGALLRDSEWKVTVTLGKRGDTVEVVLIEPGNTASKNFGLCFDIGTTTISGQLIDLKSKKILGTRASYNKQAAFGSDVITRIIYAQKEDGLERLHNAVIDTMNQIIRELIFEHKVDLNDVTCIFCAGNTTMIHLLLAVSPEYIRKEPYLPVANFIPTIRAQEAGININPRGLLSCAAGVASYVGADMTAGILSCGLYQQEELGILVDIGTNGEICLGNKDFLIACAASAGPAFEGSGVSCGMRAAKGAIEKVKINAKDFAVSYSTIGDAAPRGICGSGYIDLIAAMLCAGIIDKGGRIKIEKHKRIRKTDSGTEFIVAFQEETDIALDIVISEADIENLKRSKAAIYSALAILIRHMKIDLSEINKIFIAGGFGTYLDIENAIKIGLLPDLARAKFVFIGNSSLAGARLMLLSSEAQKTADDIARKVTYFELSVEPKYMDEYIAALFFPHTDLKKFPSLSKYSANEKWVT